MLRELFHTSLGASSLMEKKLRKELNTLEKKGKIRKDDMKDLFENLEKIGKKEDKKRKKRMKSLIKEILEELDVPSKKDIEDLKELIKNNK